MRSRKMDEERGGEKRDRASVLGCCVEMRW